MPQETGATSRKNDIIREEDARALKLLEDTAKTFIGKPNTQETRDEAEARLQKDLLALRKYGVKKLTPENKDNRGFNKALKKSYNDLAKDYHTDYKTNLPKWW